MIRIDKWQSGSTIRALILIFGIIIVYYSAIKAIDNSLFVYPPEIDCKKLLDRYQDYFSKKPIIASNRVIITRCDLDTALYRTMFEMNSTLILKTEDSTLLVPLFLTGYENESFPLVRDNKPIMLLIDNKFLKKRLLSQSPGEASPDTSNSAKSLSSLDGILCSIMGRNDVFEFADPSLKSKEILLLDLVPKLYDTDSKSTELKWWLSIILVTALAMSALLLIRFSTFNEINNPLSEIQQLTYRKIFPKVGPHSVMIGTAPLWRGLILSLNRSLPYLLFIVPFEYMLLISQNTFNSDTSIIIDMIVALLLGILVFFSFKRMMTDALIRNGSWICLLLIIFPLLVIILILTKSKVSIFAEQSDIAVILWSLIFLVALILYGIMTFMLRKWKISGFDVYLNLLPKKTKRTKNSGKITFRQILLNLELIGNYLLAIPFFLMGPLQLTSINNALSSHRNRIRWMKRRYTTPPAKQIMETDDRPPIILLRSFTDDGLKLEVETDIDRFTFEEALTFQLNRWGPVIAIGRPGEEMPQTGAAREYINGDNWQERVSSLVGKAQCLIFIVNKTEGLKWELVRVKELGSLCKTLFIFPPLKFDEVEQRWNGLWNSLDQTLSKENIELLKSTIINFLPFTDKEVAIRTLKTRLSPNDYDLGLELGMELIQAYNYEIMCS
jgi:hypothetical protein